MFSTVLSDPSPPSSASSTTPFDLLFTIEPFSTVVGVVDDDDADADADAAVGVVTIGSSIPKILTNSLHCRMSRLTMRALSFSRE